MGRLRFSGTGAATKETMERLLLLGAKIRSTDAKPKQEGFPRAC
jgi:hypothetical protein